MLAWFAIDSEWGGRYPGGPYGVTIVPNAGATSGSTSSILSIEPHSRRPTEYRTVCPRDRNRFTNHPGTAAATRILGGTILRPVCTTGRRRLGPAPQPAALRPLLSRVVFRQGGRTARWETENEGAVCSARCA